MCSALYSDFVVWREDELFVQHICLGEPFIAIVLENAIKFIVYQNWNSSRACDKVGLHMT